jgi:SsrA-binding protein
VSEGIKIVAKNKAAGFKYELFERFEAGLVLTGSEVKSLREGKVSIKEAFARIKNGECWIYNMDISAYKYARAQSYDPKRPRKLLLNKREIKRIVVKVLEKGFTIIPCSLYFKKGYAKVEIAVARGRKLHDKRQKIRTRESRRELRKYKK